MDNIPRPAGSVDKDLLGHWEFEGNSVDSSSYRRDGKVVGAEFVSGRVGKHALKVGPGKYFEVAHHSDFDFEKDFTISIWVYKEPDSPQWRYGPIASKGDRAWRLQLSRDSKKPVFHLFTSSRILTINGEERDLREGRWQHIAVVYNGKTLFFYIDAKLIGKVEPDQKVAFKTNTFPIRFGGNAEFQERSFNGVLDDARIYRKALELSAIRKLASGESPLTDR